MSDVLEPFDGLTLRRWPRLKQERLRAWDGADRYLLRTLDEAIAGPGADPAAGEGTLVVNDQCGALWLAAAKRGPAWSSGDSWLSRQAALRNGQDNQVPLREADWLWPDQRPALMPARVLMRIPKELSLLEFQLAELSGWLPEGTPVWLAGMDKHLPPSLLALMQQWLGNGRADLGWKKAHRFFATAPGQALLPAPEPAVIPVPGQRWTLIARAGVFGRRHLDIGARFLLAHLPSGVTGEVADLGCGNGVLGLALAASNPQARVTFCDESWSAVASARENAEMLAVADGSDHEFHLGNGLDGLDRQFDLVLLNPPFHRGHAVDDQVARTLLRHAARHLSADGEVRIVANRHLDYRHPLERLFAQMEVLASNAKFVIYRCTRSKVKRAQAAD